MSAPEPGRRAQAGFTLVEVMVALLLLTVGLLSTATVYASSRGLTGVSEQTSVLTHRAQAEIERIQALGWDAVALSGTPTPSADPQDPASMLVAGSPPGLRPDRRSASAVESLVVDPVGGRVDPAARSWSDGRLSGRIHTWVSWRTDPYCGVGCPGAKNAKRITVVVTVDGRESSRGPVVTSVLLTDPNAAPAGAVLNGAGNPLSDPATVCVSPSGAAGPCSRGIGAGSTTSFFLYDTPADARERNVDVADHAVRPTLAGPGPCTPEALGGCPMPDLMGDEPPPSGTTDPPPVDRSTDLPGSASSGGRVVQRSNTSCDGTPPADNAAGHRWVTPAQTEGRTLRGDGGMTLYTRTRTGVEARVVLCVQLSVAPGPIGELLTVPPTVLGTFSYELGAWPAVTTPVSFTFGLPGAGLDVPAGRRIGVRVWVAAASAADVVLAYDHPTLASTLQLNLR